MSAKLAPCRVFWYTWQHSYTPSSNLSQASKDRMALPTLRVQNNLGTTVCPPAITIYTNYAQT